MEIFWKVWRVLQLIFRSECQHRSEELAAVEQRHRTAVENNADALSKLFNELVLTKPEEQAQDNHNGI